MLLTRVRGDVLLQAVERAEADQRLTEGRAAGGQVGLRCPQDRRPLRARGCSLRQCRISVHRTEREREREEEGSMREDREGDADDERACTR